MRRDAAANRERLIEAGQHLLREQGGDLPMESFCEAANVTRATFYRHFADRAALYHAVLDQELANMAAQLANPQIEPLAFLRMLADMSMIYDRFMASLPDLPEGFRTLKQEQKIHAVIAAPLARAQAQGAIRSDITCDDVMVACRMIGCSWGLDRQPSRTAALDRRLALILDGLRTLRSS
ncbi:TetR/AcrR family transcriptional regulator [Sphingomonas sp. DC2300-3]|uniref:TetR/AcrR family transcriptional regulator n=1 Tax=unclassified Sphingomonas TaxID=196159 RepID=UPI003CF5883E